MTVNEIVNRINDSVFGTVLEKLNLTPIARRTYRHSVSMVTSDTRSFEIDKKTVTLSQKEFGEIRTLNAFEQEIPIVEDLCDRLEPTDVVWDIGAHIGAYSCSIKITNPETTVLAFEPTPYTASRLRKNASKNNVNFDVHEIAITDSDDEVTMELEQGESLSGQNSLTNDGRGDITVEGARIDSLVEDGFEKPTVLKIDVEGAEGLVLNGAESTLKDVRAVYCEIHPDRLFSKLTVDDLRTYLINAGFEVEIIHNRKEEKFMRGAKRKK